MEDENKLSVFGWLIILIIFAGICYWFSISESSNVTPINVLSILAKSLILSLLFITQLIAYEKNQDSLMTYANVISVILSFETFICNVTNPSVQTLSFAQFLDVLAIILGSVSAFFTFFSLCISISRLIGNEDGELQALKDSLKQNPVTRLMFKQLKQEKPDKKVKM